MNLNDYANGLNRVLKNIDPPDHNYKPGDDPHRKLVIQNVQDAMKLNGYEVSLSQAEDIWSAYSFNSFAGWMVGGETVDGALSAIVELCKDIETGENHIDW